MSMIAGLLLIQGAPNLVQERTPELDAANDCLLAQTGAWLRAHDWLPGDDERWRWAGKIVERCADAVEASALPVSDPESPLRKLAADGAQSTNLNNRDLRRTEALYYVDRLIREHFEGQQK